MKKRKARFGEGARLLMRRAAGARRAPPAHEAGPWQGYTPEQRARVLREASVVQVLPEDGP